MSEIKTIIWDVDDVLNDLMRDWLQKFWIINHPDTSIKYEDLIENPPHKCLGISLQEYKNSLDLFRMNYGTKLKPIPEVLDWFSQYGSNYRHIALTAVPISFADISAAWVFKHFGKWIRSFNIVPSPRNSDPEFNYDKTKKEFLEWIKVGDILVEDNANNIIEAEQAGIKTITISRPWNNGHHSITDIQMLLTNL